MMSKYILKYDDIIYNRNLMIENYIYKICKNIASEKNKYLDFSGYKKNVIKQHYNNIKQVTIDYIDVTNNIIIMLYYINNRPPRVYFVDLADEMTTEEFYEKKAFIDFTKLKIK